MTASKILFVGSVPLEDAEQTFRLLSQKVGGAASRLPDGETGVRRNWIRWQAATFADHPDFALVAPDKSLPGYQDALKRPFFDLRPGVDAASVSFGELGYAREAVRSYEVFRRLQADGTIAPGTRFQVSIPTALDILTGFVELGTRAAVEPAFEAALQREVRQMEDAIPHDRLAIQWDAAMEATGYDGGFELHLSDILPDSVERMVRQISFASPDVEVGVHLCYGDPGHKHVIEPKDLGTCVLFANAIAAAATRKVNWIHMPVPRERDDDAYFVPLRELRLQPETELFLGLVHLTNGLAGTTRRIATARKYAGGFGIATECGFGRRDPASIDALLDVHVRALALV